MARRQGPARFVHAARPIGLLAQMAVNRSPKQFGNGSVASNGAPKATEGVWHLEKRMEAARREIDRIQANPDNKMQVEDSFDRVLKPEFMAKVKALKASI
jgi:hypothetical protein